MTTRVNRCASVWAALLLMTLSACGGDDGVGASPDADVNDADVPDTGATDGGAATSGAGGTAGSGGTGGMAGNAGTGGTSGTGGTGGIVIPPWDPPPPPTRLPVSCDGSEWSCSLHLGSVTCDASPGCTWERDCTGIARSCYSQFSSYSCNRQQGCYWSTYTDSCSGSAWSCSLMSGSYSCTDQDGCNWNEECTGFATSCSSLSSFTCESQEGCYLNCDLGLEMCGSQCVDTLDDELNCGSCGRECGYRGSCTDGHCECAAPGMLCGSSCVDVRNDDFNCGTCGNACGSGNQCVDGDCQDLDECRLGICRDGRQCTNTPGGYNCGPCPSGFNVSGDGCADIDECQTNNGGCASVASCVNNPGGRTCGPCPQGYSGDGNTSCTDIDECQTNNGGCGSLTTCTNTPGGRTCGSCPSGYSGGGATGCTDIDECQTNNGGCDSRTTCTNTPGGRTCGSCPSGFSGNGAAGCVDVDECTANTDNCNSNARCDNNAGSFACTCLSGFDGDGVTCVDTDECALGTAWCDSVATCLNTSGSFTCTCPQGYSGDGVYCADINECLTAPCASSASCLNTQGSFTCTCLPGFTGDGSTACTDIDECSQGTQCGANATCTNTPGSFGCGCNAGYRLSAGTCVDVDECVNNTDGCSAVPDACVNTNGSFACSCPSGFTGNGVGVNGCLDVDECQAPTSPCSAHATCTNSPGDFVCECQPGYTGDGVTCLVVSRLTALRVTPGTLAFDPARLDYIVSIPLATTSVTVTATGAGVLQVNGGLVTSGAASPSISIANAPTVVTVTVQNPGGTISTYTITVLRGGPTYVKERTATTDEYFGLVAIDGTTLAVGASNTQNGRGRVHVYQRNAGTWTGVTTLSSPNTIDNSQLGAAVAIDGDTIVAGAPTAGVSLADHGRVVVYQRTGNVWGAPLELLGTDNYPFGEAVAIDADTIIVGVPRAGFGGTSQCGRAEVFVRNGATWSRQQVLGAPDAVPGGGFGMAVAVSGNYAAVSAPSQTGETPVYVFERSGSTWSFVTRIDPPLYGIGGQRIALDGSTLAVAGDMIRVYVAGPGGWTLQAELLPATNTGFENWASSAMALRGDRLLFGNDSDSSDLVGYNPTGGGEQMPQSGAAFVFERTGSTWSQTAYLKASNPMSGAYFGTSVALSADSAVVASPLELSRAIGINGDQLDRGGAAEGAAYIYLLP